MRRTETTYYVTPTCVAPRHVDAPRDLFLIFSERAARAGGGGGGGGFFLLFFLCSADRERDWPPCKVVFFGLATNALNVRNNIFKQQRQATNATPRGMLRKICSAGRP